jgi:nucleoside-diphosphate-sugar epimerase
VARVLIVGCGCRGRSLAVAAAADGYQVRGTSRDPRRLARIEAAGIEAVVADPLRLATLMRPIDGVSAVCWLMGSAQGTDDEVAALHETRLESMLDLLIDTHVRGFVYEAAGAVEPRVLERGAAIVERAARASSMPAASVTADPGDRGAWLAAMTGAFSDLLRATG